MQVFVNEEPVDLISGMQMKHVLIRSDKMAAIDAGFKVYDEWGHELGLDGAVAEGIKIFVR